MTEKQIAEEKMHIGYTTLKEWKGRFPSFAAALKNGKEVADYAVENALYRKATGGDTAAMIFWLKNRRPDKWKDKPSCDGGGAQTELMIALLNCRGKGELPLEYKTGDEI